MYISRNKLILYNDAIEIEKTSMLAFGISDKLCQTVYTDASATCISDTFKRIAVVYGLASTKAWLVSILFVKLLGILWF